MDHSPLLLLYLYLLYSMFTVAYGNMQELKKYLI